MPKLHLTDTSIAAIEHPENGQILYWDKGQVGFGVRVTAKKKVFIAQGVVNGKDRRVVVGEVSKLTSQAARKLAKTKLGEMADDVDHNAEKAAQRAKTITLEQVFEDYKVSRKLRDKSLKNYSDAMDRFFADWKGARMTDITRGMVRERFAAIIDKVTTASLEKRKEAIGKNTSANRGKAQASLAMRLLSSLFAYAQEKYEDDKKRAVVTENPVKGLKVEDKGWRTVPPRKTVIEPRDLNNFFKGVQELNSETARDYLMLLVLSGLRRREAGGLTWDEVDLTNKTIKLPGARTKNNKEHELPLSDYLQTMLERRQLNSSSQYVFPARATNKPYDDPSASIRTVSKLMGKTFSCHDCRRTFITVAESLDIPAYALKALVNHSRSGDVTSGYIIINVERLRQPMQKITDFMIEKMGAGDVSND